MSVKYSTNHKHSPNIIQNKNKDVITKKVLEMSLTENLKLAVTTAIMNGKQKYLKDTKT